MGVQGCEGLTGLLELRPLGSLGPRIKLIYSFRVCLDDLGGHHGDTCCVSSINRQGGERNRPQAELVVGEATGGRRQDAGILGGIQSWYWDGTDHSWKTQPCVREDGFHGRHPSVHTPTHPPTKPSIHPSTHPPSHLSIRPSIHHLFNIRLFYLLDNMTYILVC